jgi:hypothetical protein
METSPARSFDKISKKLRREIRPQSFYTEAIRRLFRRASKPFVAALLSLVLLSLGEVATTAAPATGQADPYMAERIPTYHAFVFGNDHYQNLPEILSSGRDFQEMRDFFHQAGYRVWDMSDGRFHTVDEFYHYMAEARKEIMPGDAVVIYYSGHGFYYGNQNWLVPLDYPGGTVDQQLLFKDAVGLDDIIAGLAEKRIDYAVAILDACRTVVSFPFNKGSGAEVLDEPRVPGFSYNGPSLIAWNVGVPTYAGGTAIGNDSAEQTSLYTKILLDALKKRPRISDLRAELDVAVNHLTVEGKIPKGAIAPRFLNFSDFSFSPQPDASLYGRQKHDWEVTMEEPSRVRVSDYLITNPGSVFSSVAWKYIDDHAKDPADAGGSSLTSAEAIDSSFPEGERTKKLIAIATSGFSVNFPRDTIGLTKSNPDLIDTSIVYADRSVDISGTYLSRYAAKGSKLKFDIALVGSANAVAVNTGQISLSAPSTTAEHVFTFDKAASVQIGDTFFDKLSGKLFAEIPSGQAVASSTSKTWTGFEYRGALQPSYNVINRALREVVINADELVSKDPGSSIAKLTEEVRETSKEILWVSIAVAYQPADLTLLQSRRAEAPSDVDRAAIDLEIDKTMRADRIALAEARLRAQDARLQLRKAGISGTRISMVSDQQSSGIGDGVRLRFFGSR